MIPAFQTAFYNMSTMLGCCLLFILAARKQPINQKAVVRFGGLITHVYMVGFVIALIIGAILTALL